jgi:(p)ppGpp synthase/HD superfamily hydrolase|tara:strand:+ start:838 stop:1395 length:558 start_codon:yes stop_codon:yes gene_type:complete
MNETKISAIFDAPEDYVHRFSDALIYGESAHDGQFRKYTGEDYFSHPVAVADLVEEYMDKVDGFSEEEILTAMTVALLHDTVEDTDVTIEDIVTRFGDEVAKGVWYLTKTPNFVGNRKQRKVLCELRLSAAPKWVKIIKMMDMSHNEQSIGMYDKSFHKVFLDETESLLAAMGMTEEGHQIGLAG